MAKRRYYGERAEAPSHRRDMFNDEYKQDKGPREAWDFHAGRDQDSFSERDYSSMRTEKMQDMGQMIREDRRAIANMPQEVMMKPYPVSGPYLPEGLDDTIREVDGQMNYDDSQRRAHFFPKKV